ncbi:TolC family protein [Ottowia beijingensis]|uniref:TolC family protein n=1 Tax=Ottowia beijingensis TaxID=1207057 RepID=UPI0028047D03|nr:TolC family protein [Ottowia beijingensis]
MPLPPDDLVMAFPADTLRQRPDVQQTEAQVRAAWARLVQADAARYPTFSLSGSLGLQALTLGGLTAGGALVRTLAAGLSLPIFDGGAINATVRAQQAAYEQARANHQSSVLTALQDVEDALVALQGDRARIGSLQAAASAAERADALARQQYQAGLIDFATVLTSQRTLLSAQDSAASVRASLANDHVALYKALGGGWAPHRPTPIRPPMPAPTPTPAQCPAPMPHLSRRRPSSPPPFPTPLRADPR